MRLFRRRIKSVLQVSGNDLFIMEAIGRIFFEPLNDISQWMGNLFYRKQPIIELQNMGYKKLEYWNEWHELIEKAEIKAYEKNKVN